jgi:hypothetical protein
MRARLSLVAFVAFGCGSSPPPNTSAEPPPAVAKAAKAESATLVTSFSVDMQNLNVDTISMREGGIRPDGNRDLVFRATIDGPVNDLFLVSVSDKGDPQYGFRADTVAGREELPGELGNVVDVGRLTLWIAVVEEGKFVNAENGRLTPLPNGTHELKLYVPNPGTLNAGTRLRLYARDPSGTLVRSAVVTY